LRTSMESDSGDQLNLARLPVEIQSRILYFTSESPQFLLLNVLPVCKSFEPAIFTAKLWRNLRLNTQTLADWDRLRNLRCLLSRVASWVRHLSLISGRFQLALLPLMPNVVSLRIERNSWWACGEQDCTTILRHLVEQTPSVTTAVIASRVSERSAGLNLSCARPHLFLPFQLNDGPHLILMASGWRQLKSFICASLFNVKANEAIVQFSDICQSLRVFDVYTTQFADIPPFL